jgi:two-component system capsular synthesis sensor histidine kinase RcsC
VLAGAVYWLGQHILQNEKDQLQADFSFLMGNINAQEQMLRTLRMQSQQAERASLASRTSVSSAAGTESPSWRFFDGQRAAASMPFTLLCQRAEFCPVTNGVHSGQARIFPTSIPRIGQIWRSRPRPSLSYRPPGSSA